MRLVFFLGLILTSVLPLCVTPNATGFFCQSELVYSVSSLLSLTSADALAQAFTGLTSTCPFYRTKSYQCRKHFPKCVEPNTLIKICVDSCLNAKTADDGLCSQSYSDAYFENECSDKAYYDVSPACEKAPGDVPASEGTVFKYVLVGFLAFIIALLLLSYCRQRMRERTLSPLELEEAPLDFPKPRPKPRLAQVAVEEEEPENPPPVLAVPLSNEQVTIHSYAKLSSVHSDDTA